MRGGLGHHFLKVITFPNMARCVHAIVQEMSPSMSRNAKEKLECWPLMWLVGQTHHRGRMKCKLVHSGLCLTSSSRQLLEYTSLDSRLMTRTLLKVTWDHPETGTKWELGNGWVRWPETSSSSWNRIVPVKVKMKLLEYEAQWSERRTSRDLAALRPMQT
jgi:hypothetical protein